MADCFISYRRTPSAPVATTIQTKLQSTHGIDAYVDTTRTDGTKVRFPERLMEAIAEAPVFVCLLGERDGQHTLESEWVLKEIEQAYNLRKFCIPVFQESYRPLATVPPAVDYLLGFDGVHYFDVKNIMVDDSVRQIAALIRPQRKRPLPIVWIAAAAVLVVVLIVGVLLLGGGGNGSASVTPTLDATPATQAALQPTDDPTPDLTRTVEMLVAQFVETNDAAATQIAATLTANFTPSATPNATQTAESVNTAAAILAAQRIGTQQAQLTANAPTITPEPPTATATYTPTVSDDELAATARIFTQTAEAVMAQTQRAVQFAAETAAAQTLTAQPTATNTPDLASIVPAPFPTVQIREIQIVRIIASTNANVRNGPGENFGVISITPPNSTYDLLEERAGWYRISPDGWVSSQIARIELSTVVDWTPQWTPIGAFKMMRVPPGCFDMGESGAGGRQCFDAPFWIGQTEVTNAQYAEFVTAGGYNEQRYWTDAGWSWKTENNVTAPENYSNSTDNNQPRVGVTWYEAVAYTHWLTEQLRTDGAIGQEEEIRLPTELEWEYAARGPDGLTYPWGNDWDETRANVSGTADGYGDVTAPVGSYPLGASWVGALDMIGNIWEWSLSGYADYPYNSTDSRNDVSSDTRRVLRGGSWHSSHNFALAAYRFSYLPYYRSNYFGFRLMLVKP